MLVDDPPRHRSREAWDGALFSKMVWTPYPQACICRSFCALADCWFFSQLLPCSHSLSRFARSLKKAYANYAFGNLFQLILGTRRSFEVKAGHATPCAACSDTMIRKAASMTNNLCMLWRLYTTKESRKVCRRGEGAIPNALPVPSRHFTPGLPAVLPTHLEDRRSTFLTSFSWKILTQTFCGSVLLASVDRCSQSPTIAKLPSL